MNFLKTLPEIPPFQDIDIRSKKELEQFIELLELSIQTLVDEDYFFEYEECKFLNYVKRLKEVVANWDNAVSNEWKEGKLLTKLKFEPQPQPNYKIEPTVDRIHIPDPLLKNLIKLVGRVLLLFIIIASILWLLTWLVKYIQNT